MSKSTLNIVSEPVLESYPLHELIRSGARKLINEAVQAEFASREVALDHTLQSLFEREFRLITC